MNKEVQKIPFLRIVIALVSGILAGLRLNLPLIYTGLLPFILLTSLVLIHLNYRYHFTALFGLITFLFYMSIGLFIVKVYKKEPVINENGIYSAIVLEIPCEKEKSVQTVLKLRYVIKNDSVLRSEEKIMAWFHKSEPALSLQPGDNVLFSHIFSEIKNYNNPFEFDYKKYLAGRRIFRQVFLNDDKWILYSGKPHPVPAIDAESSGLKLLSV